MKNINKHYFFKPAEQDNQADDFFATLAAYIYHLPVRIRGIIIALMALYFIPEAEASIVPSEHFFQDPNHNSSYMLAVYNYGREQYDSVLNEFMTICNATLSNTNYNQTDFTKIITHAVHGDRMPPNELTGFDVSRLIFDLSQEIFETCLKEVSSDLIKKVNNRDAWVYYGFFIAMGFVVTVCCVLNCCEHWDAIKARLNRNLNDMWLLLNLFLPFITKSSFQARLNALPEIYKSKIPKTLKNEQGLIMNDPITVSSGVTYDRRDIQIKFTLSIQASILYNNELILRTEFAKLKTDILVKNIIEDFINKCEKAHHKGEPLSILKEYDESEIDPGDYENRLDILIAKDFRIVIPHDMYCTVEKTIMEEPVTLLSGKTISTNALEWMISRARDNLVPYITCGETRMQIPISYCQKLKTNKIIKNWIRAFVEDQEKKYELYQTNRAKFETRFPISIFEMVRQGIAPLNNLLRGARWSIFSNQGYRGLPHSGREFEEHKNEPVSRITI